MGNEIQNKNPQLPDNYWQKTKPDEQKTLADVNANFALKDLQKISIFNSQK